MNKHKKSKWRYFSYVDEILMEKKFKSTFKHNDRIAGVEAP